MVDVIEEKEKDEKSEKSLEETKKVSKMISYPTHLPIDSFSTASATKINKFGMRKQLSYGKNLI